LVNEQQLFSNFFLVDNDNIKTFGVS